MKEPIRILHILQRMEAGGTQALLMNLYRNIDRTKVQFDFLVEYNEKQFYDDEIIKLGGKIYYTNVRNDFNIFKFQKRLKEVLLNNDYKIVHVHAYTIGYFCLKIAKKCGVPVRIAHSHSNSMVKNIKMVPKKILQGLFLIHSTDLFACSDEAGKYLFKNREFHVLKNAIDSTDFVFNFKIRENIRKELNIGDELIVGHVGRFQPEKNHNFLLSVFLKIKKLKKEAKLLLIGSGPLEKEIKNKIEKYNLKDSIIMLSNRNDMNRLYMAMDVFVFPSKYEGLGIVAIESQAAGIPTIISDGVPNETIISPICKKLSLSTDKNTWAKEAIKMSENKLAYGNMQKYIIDAGYDMKNTSKWLQEYYLQKHNEKDE